MGDKIQEGLRLPRISPSGHNVTSPADESGRGSSAAQILLDNSQTLELALEVLVSEEQVVRRDIISKQDVDAIRIVRDVQTSLSRGSGETVPDAFASYHTQYLFSNPQEFWETVWKLQKDEEILRSALVAEEAGTYSRLQDVCGGGRMGLAAGTIQRGWRCHEARTTVRRKMLARNAEEAVYHPAIANSTVQFHYPRPGQAPYEVPKLPAPPGSGEYSPDVSGLLTYQGGGDLTLGESMQRVKDLISRFGPQQNAQLYEVTQQNFPQAIEVDPDKNMCTINLYSLDRVALEDFHRHATYIAHHFPTLGTYSGTQGLIPPRGPVPTDEQSIVKREVLARRIADLVPENQKTLIMHLRRLAPYVIKIQDGVGMIDTGDLDEPRYQQTNVIVLELLQVQRDQNVDIREALEAERLRIAKEREELELQREKEEAEQMKNRREIMDKAWLQEQQIRDYEERQLLLRMRQQEELDRKRLAIDQEKKLHEERLKWEQQEYMKKESERQRERDEKFRLRQQLNDLEQRRLDHQRHMDTQEREYQRRLRQLEMREKELEFQRSMKSAEEKETLELSRKSLAKELDLLDESQTALLRTYARDITPKAVQEERVVPDHVSGHAIPCLLAYAQQLRSASSASPSHMPRPPAKQTPEATYRRPSNNADMRVAAAPQAPDAQPSSSADQVGDTLRKQPTMDDRFELSDTIGKLQKVQQKKLCDHLQKHHPSAIFTVEGRVGVDTANLSDVDFWAVSTVVQDLSVA
jgi:hypothetical protein